MTCQLVLAQDLMCIKALCGCSLGTLRCASVCNDLEDLDYHWFLYVCMF